MKTLQDKIEFIFTVTFDGSGTQYSMVNKAIQELRNEITKRYMQSNEYDRMTPSIYNRALRDILTLIGEKK